MGKGLFDPLYPVSQITWIDGFTLAHAPTQAQLQSARLKGSIRTIALRHPVDRIVSQFFATWEARKPMNFREWVGVMSRPAHRGTDGKVRLWIELDNVFTKVLSGFDGSQPFCRAGEPGCQGGVDRQALGRAKENLKKEFDLVLITEWLDHPASVLKLADLFCFAHDHGVIQKQVHASWMQKEEQMPIPDLRSKKTRVMTRRASPKAEDIHRSSLYANESWAPEPDILEDLWVRNGYDIELFETALQDARAMLTAHWTRHYSSGDPMPHLPEVPCSKGNSGSGITNARLVNCRWWPKELDAVR